MVILAKVGAWVNVEGCGMYNLGGLLGRENWEVVKNSGGVLSRCLARGESTVGVGAIY